jgi:hypothetical protein
MQFKETKLVNQFAKTPTLLKRILGDADRLAKEFGKEITLTRILGKIEGDSEVHRDYRAADARDEHGGQRVFTLDERLAIIHYINARYPRTDISKTSGKPLQTCYYHSFKGGPEHFHFQVSALTKNHRQE